MDNEIKNQVVKESETQNQVENEHNDKNGNLLTWIIVGIIVLVLIVFSFALIISYNMRIDKSTTAHTTNSNSSYNEFASGFSAGRYYVGIDIPAGTYTVTALKGNGNVYVYNKLNADLSEDDVCDDLELTDGEFVEISDNLVVQLKTLNASEKPLLPRLQSHLSEHTFSSGIYECGKDFESGFYNIVAIKGDGAIFVGDHFYEYLASSGEIFAQSFRNLPITDGNSLFVGSNLTIKLVPSKSSPFAMNIETTTSNTSNTSSNTTSTTTTTTTTITTTTTTTTKVYPVFNGYEIRGDYYTSGQGKVGTDIPAGEYILIATDSYSGYFCVSSDANQDDIIFNDTFEHNSIITIYNGEFVEFSRCVAVPLNVFYSNNKIDTTKDGVMLKVGVDISAGEYKLKQLGERTGYYCIYNNSRQEDIISNDHFENQTYITISNGQYLILNRCYID